MARDTGGRIVVGPAVLHGKPVIRGIRAMTHVHRALIDHAISLDANLLRAAIAIVEKSGPTVGFASDAGWGWRRQTY